MRGRCGSRLVPVPPGDMGPQAGGQGGGTAAGQRGGQVAMHIGIAQLAAGTDGIVGGQVLGVGEQLIDLPIAIHAAGLHHQSSAGDAGEGALVEGADGLESIPLRVGAQARRAKAATP